MNSTTHAEYEITPLETDSAEERAAVFEFMQKDFRYDEPITRAVGATEEDTYDFYTDLCAHGFSGPYSLVARVKGAPEIVGVALNAMCEEEEQPTANGNAVRDDGKTEFGKGILPLIHSKAYRSTISCRDRCRAV